MGIPLAAAGAGGMLSLLLGGLKKAVKGTNSCRPGRRAIAGVVQSERAGKWEGTSSLSLLLPPSFPLGSPRQILIDFWLTKEKSSLLNYGVSIGKQRTENGFRAERQ